MTYRRRVRAPLHRLSRAGFISASAALSVFFSVSVITPVDAAPAAKADGSWSMVPMSKDANGDGFIDGDGGVPKKGALTAEPSSVYVGADNYRAQPNERLIGGALSWHLNPAGYPVRLNACASTGDTYEWRIFQGDTLVTSTKAKKLKKSTCKTNVTLPEGSYSAELIVRAAKKRNRLRIPLTVDNILFVSMGDSYASGEGNPRNVEAFLQQGSAGFRPYWDDNGCNRSARGGPAQAALALENASPKTSVTFVYVACSGATVRAGILGPQRTAGQTVSQIEQVASIIGDRTIDLLTMSIGGNDVGFTSLMTTCATATNCPLSPARVGNLTVFPTVQEGVQTLTGRLPGSYAAIASCLDGGRCELASGSTVPSLRLTSPERVLPSLYPDITRDVDGSACSYLTIDRPDFQWARDTMLTPSTANPYAYRTTSGSMVDLATNAGTLNGAINGTQTLGWNPVVGTWGASGESQKGHGVCAGAQAWVFGLTGIFGFTSGSFHPNVPGQEVLGKQIAEAARVALTQ